jgi:hypothetical protein
MLADDRLHVTVELEPAGDPICGTLADGAGPPIAFSGWLELMSGFETIRDRADVNRQRG